MSWDEVKCIFDATLCQHAPLFFIYNLIFLVYRQHDSYVLRCSDFFVVSFLQMTSIRKDLLQLCLTTSNFLELRFLGI